MLYFFFHVFVSCGVEAQETAVSTNNNVDVSEISGLTPDVLAGMVRSADPTTASLALIELTRDPEAIVRNCMAIISAAQHRTTNIDHCCPN